MPRRSNGPFVAKAQPAAPAPGVANIGSSAVQGATNQRIRDLELYYMLATKHPNVLACITLIADAIAAEGYAIAPADGETAKPLSVEDDPRVDDIRTFFRIGFVGMTLRSALVALAIDQRTYGVAYLRKARAAVDGVTQLVGLERIDPRTVAARLADDKRSIAAYLVMPRDMFAGAFARQQSQAQTVPVADMIVFRQAGGDPLTGMPSPLEGLDLTLAHDLAARRWRESFFRNGARPGLILASKTARKEQYEAVKEEIRKQKTGADAAFTTMLVAGEWEVVAQPDSGSNDIDFAKGAGLNREEVCAVYRVPVGMLTFSGAALGSAGKGDDRDFFEEFAVLPLEELIYETLTVSVLRDELGITDLHLVPKRRSRIRLGRFDAAVKMVRFGATGNEARELVGLAPIDDEAMNEPLFIGVSTMGFQANEGKDEPVPPVAGASEASAAADAAEHHHDEVAQKGGVPFRRTRTQGRQAHR